ncbi:hypothetical protein PF011_g24903, partial [Phytophthora fragariae]
MGCLLTVCMVLFCVYQPSPASSGSTTATGSNMPAGVKVSLAALAACVCCVLTFEMFWVPLQRGLRPEAVE